MRWNASGLALQRFAQGSVTPQQITMSFDGRILYAQETLTNNVYTINRVPSTAVATSLGTIVGAATNAIDLSAWPCTYPC